MAEALGRTYADGEIVIRQGERGEHMFVVQRGRVEVLREEQGREVRVGFMERGDVFGEMGIIERTVRSATVRACGPANILTLDRRMFLARAQEDPVFVYRVLEALCGRVRRLDAQNAALRAKLAELPVAEEER